MDQASEAAPATVEKVTQSNDGGPAFPFVAEGGPDSGLHPELYPGMSLRDWFAGQALISFECSANNKAAFSYYAQRAYLVADAMIAAQRGDHTSASADATEA